MADMDAGQMRFRIHILETALGNAAKDVARLQSQLKEARDFAFAMNMAVNELDKWCRANWVPGETKGFDRKSFDEHLMPMLKQHGFRVLSPDEAKVEAERIAALQRAAAETKGVRVLGVDGKPTENRLQKELREIRELGGNKVARNLFEAASVAADAIDDAKKQK